MNTLTHLLHRRYATILMAMVTVCMAVWAHLQGDNIPDIGDRGLIFPSANLWFGNGTVSLAASVMCICGIAAMVNNLNKNYNLMRSLTSMWGTLFLALMCGTPVFMTGFYGGTLLCLVMCAALPLLYFCHDNKKATRRVFLLFTLLSAAALCQYAYLFFVPVFLVGLVQMRIWCGRTVLAALIGLVTPAWIVFGSGIADLSDINLPQFHSVFSAIRGGESIQTFVTVGVTVLSSFFFLTSNLMRMLGYNARFRAFNGVLALLLPVVTLLLFVDWLNFPVYVPLLTLLGAYQGAHYFTHRRYKHSYIAVLILISLYLALCLWSLAI